MGADLAAVLAIALSLMGIVGVVLPVLPGVVFLLVGQVVWLVWGGAPWRWPTFVVAVGLLLAGSLASLVLTQRNLARRGVPPWPVTVALAVGVVAGFIWPGLGLVVGFVAGLLVCELVRVRHLGQALRSSWTAITSVGLGVLVELACDLAACSVLGASILLRWW